MTWTNLLAEAWGRLTARDDESALPGVNGAHSAPATNSPPPRVLVVDDDPVIRLVLGAPLREAGYEIREASDGVEGLTLFREEPADIVLVDLVMPHQGGLETIRELRDIAPSVWIIVVSGVGGGCAEYLRAAVRLGADRVLPKPVNPEELQRMVAGLLAQRR